MNSISQLLSPDFMPHGYCYLWEPLILWLHVVSDALIAISYFCIPLALASLVRRRRDWPFNWIFWMFAVFIVSCGMTHLMEIWNVWHASYLVSGLVKAVTAVASLITAVMLVPLIPQAAALPSVEQLRLTNSALESEMKVRRQVERELREILAERERTLADLVEHKCAIEDLKLTQAALARSQDQLDAIIHSAMDAIITTDDQQRVLIFNAAAETMFGCSSDEAVGKTLDRFIPQRFRSTHANHVRDFAETGVTSRSMGTLGAIWGLRSNGTEFPVEASISQVETGDRRLFTVILRDISERLHAEKARGLMAAVVESSDDAIISNTLDGTIASWNRGAENIFDYTAGEAIGKSTLMLFPPERAGEAADILASIARGNSVRHYETVRMRKDGQRIDVSVTISPIKDASGATVGASRIAHDITERKRAQAALRESEERLRLFVEHAPAALAMFDREMRYLQASRRWCADYGLGDRNLHGASHYELFPDISEHWKEIHRRGLAGEILRAESDRFDRADGSTQWIKWEVRPWFKIKQEIGGIVIFAEDITTRKQAEAALQASEERFHTLANTMPQLVWMAEPDGHVFWYNRRWYEYTGTTFEQMEGWAWQSVHDPQVLPKVLERWKGAIASAQPFVMEFPIRGADGRFRTFLTRVLPLKDSEGNVVRWFGTNTDISERKEAEERLADQAEELSQQAEDLLHSRQALQVLNAELEHRVQERTSQLEAANKELEAFTYSVSHDLRAPLRHISGFSKMLAEELGSSAPGQGQHYLQRIQDGTQRMGQLVDDLLNLGRVGRREMHLKVTGLESLVREIIVELQSDCAGKQVEWKVAELPFVECDPGLLKQVFQNLLANAVKFTRPRAASVIEIGQQEINGATAIFVRDNGVGFSMKYADKLFGVFQRLHRQEDFEGTGVGLATVQRIILKHGGRIWAEAELDQGATFYFTLAASSDRNAVSAEAAAAGGTTGGAAAGTTGGKI